jgi:hypothetical protein
VATVRVIPRDRLTAALLAATLFAGAASFSQNIKFANEDVRFMLVQAIVEQGTLNIDHFKPDPNNDVSFHDGHYYPNKGPGQSLLGVPVYWLTKRVLHIAPQHPLDDLSCYLMRLGTTTLAFGLLGGALFLAARRLGAAAGDAAAMVLAYGFGSIAFIHALLFGGHQLAAGLSFISFAGLVALSKRKGSPGAGSAALAFGSGLAAGVAALSDYTAMFTALVLGVYALRLHVPVRDRAAFLLGGAPSVAVLAAYNTACFGGPFAMSYRFLTNEAFAEGARRGFLGIGPPSPAALVAIVFSPARGLLFIMPIFAFSLLGLRRMWTRGLREEVVCLAAVALGYLAINAGFYGWHGGWTYGPRYLTPMLPFLAVPLAFARLRSPGFLIALGLSLFQVIVAAVTINQVPESIANPLPEVVIPLLRDGLTCTNLGSVLGLEAPWSFLPVIALLAALGFALTRIAGPLSRSVEPAWVSAAAVIGAVAVVVSLLVVRTEPRHFAHCARAELLFRAQDQGAFRGDTTALDREANLCRAGAR